MADCGFRQHCGAVTLAGLSLHLTLLMHYFNQHKARCITTARQGLIIYSGVCVKSLLRLLRSSAPALTSRQQPSFVFVLFELRIIHLTWALPGEQKCRLPARTWWTRLKNFLQNKVTVTLVSARWAPCPPSSCSEMDLNCLPAPVPPRAAPSWPIPAIGSVGPVVMVYQAASDRYGNQVLTKHQPRRPINRP